MCRKLKKTKFDAISKPILVSFFIQQSDLTSNTSTKFHPYRTISYRAEKVGHTQVRQIKVERSHSHYDGISHVSQIYQKQSTGKLVTSQIMSTRNRSIL